MWQLHGAAGGSSCATDLRDDIFPERQSIGRILQQLTDSTKNAGKSGNDPKMDPMFLKAGLHVCGSYQQSSMSARDKCIETI